jgi:FtsP/CotA-like multicopper oxidase with cupredoxin domain
MQALTRRGFMLSVGAAALTSTNAFGEQAGVNAKAGTVASPDFAADVEINLICQRDVVSILKGAPTKVWRYAGELVKGPANTLTPVSGAYLGPTLRFVKGQKIRIRLKNDLPEDTIAHWHGLHVPMAADGHPSAAIAPGASYVYEFEMRNRASMNFYHPHTHEATATQVYRGLAGLIMVEDEEERALGLPGGEFEIPLVIQDRSFDQDNQLLYGGGMHRNMFGFYGDTVLVNGRPNYRLEVASRAYRLRLLNASNARIYKLAWDDGSPLTVIGTDGGLLEKPETRRYVMLAPSERIDLWVDFSGRPAGAQMVMRSLGFSGLIPSMAMGMSGDDDAVETFPVFTVAVTRAVSDSPKLPERLTPIRRYHREDLANPNNPRPIAINMGHMRMSLNGDEYGQGGLQPGERVPVDSVQMIEIFHDHGGMGHGMGSGMGMGGGMRGMGGGMMGPGMGMMGMMSMAHPIHLHGQQFQILERSFDGDADARATYGDGFVDSGWKDTVLVAPGERVKIAKPFGDFKGRFMYHCHNLEHEDMGMMREFSVE